MTSSGALTELSTGPLYFFDQPTKRNRTKWTRSNILHFNVAKEEEQTEDAKQSPEDGNRGGINDELSQRMSGGTCADVEPDTAAHWRDPMDAYRRAAPQMLNELGLLLSQRRWTEEGRFPHGIVNILNYSWQDLTAGAASPEQERGERWRGPLRAGDAGMGGKAEAGESVAEDVAPSLRKPQVCSNPGVKKRKHKPNRAAHVSTTVSFSISSNNHEGPGWIIQQKQPPCDEPQPIGLCQWVVERLQAARNPEKLRTTDQHLTKPLILRHYGDEKAKLKDRRAQRKAQPITLVNGMPQIPEVKQQDPTQQKLHYRIDDGSSFVSYLSGCMAVSQSCSGLPCGGFYTNVFSDSECPVILATITAFGRGTVTHPLSSATTAVWDQDGGFICDHNGKIIKEWSWQTGCTPRKKIIIQLSDLISVRLLSGTSAILSFRCNDESVQLPLSALCNINQSKEMPALQTEGKFTSDAADELLLAMKTKSPAVPPESNRNLTLTTVSGRSRDVLQMVREVDGVEEPSAQWRRGGQADRELKRLQQRVRTTLDNWLDYYRVATGIKCPAMQRMPDAPLRTRLRREEQSAALPSLNPPGRTDAKPVQTEEGRNELQELHRHPLSPAERALDCHVKLPRTPKKRMKEEPRITQIGPLQIHGNFQLESVIIPKSPDLQPSAVAHRPAPPSFTPSTPLTVCPPLLRAALLGEGGRRRCCCSTTLMPVVTDLEYDAFIMGQPPHSQQILVVCVTPPRQPNNTQVVHVQEMLEQLYRGRNKHRSMPCTQCQMDSFRLVRYEMSTVKPSCGEENILLQQRHNAAPGMVLMYIRGKLLFVGHIFSGRSCSVRDLQKQISSTRRDYRLGLSLASDYKFSDIVNAPAAADTHSSQDVTLKGGDDMILCASAEKEKTNEKKNNQVPEASHQQQRDFCIKPKKTPALLHVPVVTH